MLVPIFIFGKIIKTNNKCEVCETWTRPVTGHNFRYCRPAMAAFVENTRKYFNSNNRVKELQAHSAKVHSVAWNSDGKRLASGSYDKTVNVFVLDRDRMVCFHQSI